MNAILPPGTKSTKDKGKGRPRRGGAAPPPVDPRPVVRLEGGQLPQAVDAAEVALLASGACDLYQYAGIVVRPARVAARDCQGREVLVWRLVELGRHALVEAFTRAARFERWDGRAHDFVPIDCPLAVAEMYRERQGAWKLPVLRGMIFAPTLRADGSILQQPGYDRASGLLYVLPPGVEFPAIPAAPSRQAAMDALAELRFAIETFPFVSPADWAVALSALLTGLVRRSLPTAPLHAFTAPTAGSGKSLLVDIVAILQSGDRAGVISQGKTEEEFEKRLGAALLAGDSIITIDNCEQPLGGDLLCQALTQEVVKPRILGVSRVPEVPSTASMFATGNNLVVIGDMTRRALLCSLDPRCERPELRQFEVEPLGYVSANRTRLVASALTVLRAFVVAGKPEQAPPLGSFEAWSSTVRNALLWLGEADPCATSEKTRADDPRLGALITVLTQWWTVFGDTRVTVRQVIEAATESDASTVPPYPQIYRNGDLREALLMVAGERGNINSRRLGKWLASVQGRIAASGRIVKDAMSAGGQLWRLEMV